MTRSRPQPWNEAQAAFIRANYSSMTRKQILEEINKLGAPHTEASVKIYLHKNKIYSGRTGRFEKGRVSENKGKKLPQEIYDKIKPYMFKKGDTPWTHCEVGEIREVHDRSGRVYLKIKIAEPNKWQHLHRFNWEQANGPLQPGDVLVFLDGNSKNCELSNLRKISNQELGLMNTALPKTDSPEAKEIFIDYAKILIKIKNFGGAENGN